jgi:uncharacterized protein (DUF927 family)
VRRFIEAHGSGRFESPWENRAIDGQGNPIAEKIANRAGFRRKNDDGWDYLILPETWREEVCKGHDASRIAQALIERNLMEKDKAGKSSLSIRVPGHGPQRLYGVRGTILSYEEPATPPRQTILRTKF